MSIGTLLILFVVCFIIIKFGKHISVGGSKKYDELLRFFGPDEKLRAYQVIERIRERTDGRRNIPDVYIHTAFNQLCKEGKLVKEITIQNVDGQAVNSAVYFLPKKSK